MGSYKIHDGTIKVDSGITSFTVTFYDDSGKESSAQYYEVGSVNNDEIYRSLDTACDGYCKLTSKQTVIPVLETEKKIEAGTMVPA